MSAALHAGAQPDTPPREGEQPSTAEPSQALVPPQLTAFVEAPYPAEAKAQGIVGQVVLQIDIDGDGKVTAVEVKKPAGHGFDEAARQAALQFVFAPAVKEGKAVPSRILYVYKFEMKEPPPPRPEAAPPPPTTGQLQGVVRLSEGEAAMPGAKVVVTAADGRKLELTADSSGRWRVSDLPPGPYEVSVSAAGFQTMTVTERVVAGESSEVVYRISPEGGPLEVTVRGARPDREITRRRIERQELEKVPGTSGDALRAVQAMPGVARAGAFEGAIVVRGSEPSGTGVFVDGTWVPNVYHFGGLSSNIPTEMIETLDFYPGNFSARYGRLSGGVIDVKTRTIAEDGKYHGLAQLDMIDARMLLEGPIPGLDSWSFIVGGRRSHLDAWLPTMLEAADMNVRSAPVYYDYQAFVETKPTKRSRFRFGIFGADDRFALTFPSGIETDPGFAGGFDFWTAFWRLQASYENKISDDLSVSMVAAYGVDKERGAIGSLRFDDSLQSLTVRGELEYAIADSLKVRVGPDILYYPYKIDIRAPQPPRPGEPDPGPYSNRPVMVLVDEGVLSGPAAWAEVEWKPTDPLQLLFGGRVDYFNANEDWNFSPRFNARYDIHGAFPRTTVKTGVGVFHQKPEGYEVADVFGSSDVRSSRAIHYSLGVEQELTEFFEVSLEGFYKDLDDQIVRVALADGSEGYANIGTGETYGLEALLRYRFDGKLFGWAAYTLSRSTRQDGPGEPERLFEYDQTHNLTVLASYALGAGWTLGSKFRYTTGTLYTPCNGGVLNAAAGAYACRSGEPYSERLDAYHQLDVRVDKKWTFDAWSLTAYLDLQNVYNRANAEAIEYNYDYSQSTNQAGLPILPNLGVRGEF